MSEIEELTRHIRILNSNLEVTNQLLKIKNSRAGELGEENEKIILEELKKKGTVYKCDIIRVCGVSANSALDIMKRLMGKNKGLIYIRGIGATPSRLISSDALELKQAKVLLDIPLFSSLSRKEVFEKLNIEETESIGEESNPSMAKLIQVIEIANTLGGEFRWLNGRLYREK